MLGGRQGNNGTYCRHQKEKNNLFVLRKNVYADYA